MNIMEMMKKAQSLQSDMAAIKQEIDEREFHADAGAGMVKVVMRANGQLISADIDPSLCAIEEREVLQDLVIAAVNHAHNERRAFRAERMRSMTDGLPIPPRMMSGFE